MQQEPVFLFLRQASATFMEHTFKTKEPNRSLFNKIVGFSMAILLILAILSEFFEQNGYGEKNR